MAMLTTTCLLAVSWSGTTYTGARSLAGSRAPSRAASRVQRVGAGGSTALSASHSRSKVGCGGQQQLPCVLAARVPHVSANAPGHELQFGTPSAAAFH